MPTTPARLVPVRRRPLPVEQAGVREHASAPVQIDRMRAPLFVLRRGAPPGPRARTRRADPCPARPPCRRAEACRARAVRRRRIPPTWGPARPSPPRGRTCTRDRRSRRRDGCGAARSSTRTPGRARATTRCGARRARRARGMNLMIGGIPATGRGQCPCAGSCTNDDTGNRERRSEKGDLPDAGTSTNLRALQHRVPCHPICSRRASAPTSARSAQPAWNA